MNTPEGAKLARQKLIEKFGSEEAYKAHMKSIASKGGRKGKGSFATVEGLASRAGKKSRKKT